MGNPRVPPAATGRGAGDPTEDRRRVCASGYLSPRQQAAPGHWAGARAGGESSDAGPASVPHC